MPWSWVRVSTGSSPKLRNCMGDDTSAGKFAACVTEIVSAHGAEVEEVKFELNGKWARVRFFWDDAQVKHAVLFDLQADEVIDLISGDERDQLRLQAD